MQCGSLRSGILVVGVLRVEHLHHRPACLGARVLWQQDSAATVVGGEADSGAELAVEDHRIVLACNDVLVGRASAAACTPHGLPHDVLHEGIIVAICPQSQPAFHPAFDVAGSDHAWTLSQDTRGEDQGTFGISPPLANAPKFPRHRRHDLLAEFPLGRVVHWMRVGDHPIVPPLPDAVVGNAPI
jgi:hypothetical protein